MYHIRITDDFDECRFLWKRLWPSESLFDLWEVRAFFAESYDRQNAFHVAEKNGKAEGLLALSRVTESASWNQFPGETWQNKTWLEQNRIIAATSGMADELINSVDGRVKVNYLRGDSVLPGTVSVTPDETGYLFYPRDYGYSYESYVASFPGKKRRKLFSEIEKLENMGVEFRYDNLNDVDLFFSMNRSVFGDYSYFSEPRFLKGFTRLISWLHDMKMLTVTTVLIGGKVAAVDVGAQWKKACTMLAGGTNPEFPGVAKLINFHHIEKAYAQKSDSLDFLCGDFGWKERFMLRPRPFMELSFNNEAAGLGYEGAIARAS